MKKILLLLLLTANFCGQALSQKLTIAVSANAQYALRELSEEFKKENDQEIDLIFGSSGKLSTQIQQGAPFHIFFSADVEFPQELYKRGFSLNPPRVYGYGALVVWTMKDIPLSKDLSILKSQDIKKIAIPNPKVAPYGSQAVKALQGFTLYDKIKKKLVYGESVSQVNQYVSTQTCDIGFTAKSVVVGSEMKGKGKWIEVDPKSYSPIAQSVVVLKRGNDELAEACEKFIDFVFSPQGRKILVKHGYRIPK